jgi:Flp pilus assembly protein CpaB
MSPRALVAVVAAAFFGIVPGFALGVGYQRFAARDELMLVMTSLEDLPRGAVLTPDLVVARELPSRYVEDRHIVISDYERIMGRHVVSPIRAGESILWTDLDGGPPPR